jgi:hypothetical protein
MAGPSTSRALTEVEQIEFLHEILDEESISEYSSDNGSVWYWLYTVGDSWNPRDQW